MEDNHLTNLQLELLKLFNRELPEEQLLEIKQILTQYFANKATEEMDRLWDEKGWSTETMEKWTQTHMRTKYDV